MTAMLCALILWGCGDDGPASDSAPLYDVALIEEMTSTSTLFAVALPQSGHVARLRSNRALATDEVKPGDCCMIRYVSPRPAYESADIDLLGCYAVTNIKASVATADEIASYSDRPVYLLSAWHFCNRVVMKMQLPYPMNDRKLMLLADSATADEEVPVLNLVQDYQGDTDKSYMKTYTVAFDLSDVNPSNRWKGVKICINNSNLPEKFVYLNFE